MARWSRAQPYRWTSPFFELVSNPIATSRCRLRFNANLFFFDGIPGLFRVQFPAGTAHFSTPFNTQGTTFSWLLLTYSICPRNMVRRKVAEPCLFLDCSSFYLIAKTLKLICSKFPRGNSKTFLLGYTHIKPVPCTPLLYPQMLKGITPLHLSRVLTNP